jgi:hypothetical protein
MSAHEPFQPLPEHASTRTRTYEARAHPCTTLDVLTTVTVCPHVCAACAVRQSLLRRPKSASARPTRAYCTRHTPPAEAVSVARGGRRVVKSSQVDHLDLSGCHIVTALACLPIAQPAVMSCRRVADCGYPNDHIVNLNRFFCEDVRATRTLTLRRHMPHAQQHRSWCSYISHHSDCPRAHLTPSTGPTATLCPRWDLIEPRSLRHQPPP